MKLSESERGFYQGVICCLAALAPHGADTIYDEIVGTLDEDVLLSEARRSGNMRWSGLDKFVRRKQASNPQLRKERADAL